ncbi:hypothetical protein L1D09_21960 [Vibrio tubiashii]|uniref:hypothetical protein n=2 Tax=Vibrio tubiashii TaxID=29498 RepID=UPI001EFE8CB5|nr:hypothetical protein [Vibrio tubiashii]MCG9584198.1 hypothetical protein [Vibrio tubiashii]MCG9617793.1 hypothetical protein [Vibrio tubiashii]
MLSRLLIFVSLSLFGSSVIAVENYSMYSELSNVLIYPQTNTTPSGVSYTELLISVPTDMPTKPGCAVHPNRFIIDSRNPLFDHVLSLALAARVAKQPVNINYWNACEASGTHRAPLIRAISM